jgi:hypothetical protein
VPEGGSGVGGAATTTRLAGMQDAVTTLPDTQPFPLEELITHQEPSAFFPVTEAVTPRGSAPTMVYTVEGPERILTLLLALTMGVQAVGSISTVLVGIRIDGVTVFPTGVAVFSDGVGVVPSGVGVGVASAVVNGRLQETTDSQMAIIA